MGSPPSNCRVTIELGRLRTQSAFFEISHRVGRCSIRTDSNPAFPGIPHVPEYQFGLRNSTFSHVVSVETEKKALLLEDTRVKGDHAIPTREDLEGLSFFELVLAIVDNWEEV